MINAIEFKARIKASGRALTGCEIGGLYERHMRGESPEWVLDCLKPKPAQRGAEKNQVKRQSEREQEILNLLSDHPVCVDFLIDCIGVSREYVNQMLRDLIKAGKVSKVKLMIKTKPPSFYAEVPKNHYALRSAPK